MLTAAEDDEPQYIANLFGQDSLRRFHHMLRTTPEWLQVRDRAPRALLTRQPL